MKITRLMALVCLAACLAIIASLWQARGGSEMPYRLSPPDAPGSAGASAKKTWTPLTPQEEKVIVACGTEKAFSGEYWNHHAPGSYACKRCGALLFPSTAKFDSGTGWPSFDDAYRAAIRQKTDPDGNRVEIVCAQCDGHLGHLFRNEDFTAKQTRHCVNSVSLRFIPEKEVSIQRAIFAGGCFWGVEYHFLRVPGVLGVTSGYTGGNVKKPTYEQVCSGTTGHAEAVEVVFDPARVSYETLAKLFFEIHNPAQKNGQGPDLGEQYRSEVFYTDATQKQTAEKLIAYLRERGLDVATRVTAASEFWPAEVYHQNYYAKTGKQPYCHRRTERFPPAGSELTGGK